MSNPNERLEALQQQHTRLHIAARQVITARESAGAGPALDVAVRRLAREVRGEPQPSGMWMSVE